MAKINGIEGMTTQELMFDLQRGGKFVIYDYCISLVIITFKRGSDIYYIKPGESAVSKGLPYIFLTLAAGLWGFPFGPIFSAWAIFNNLRGGKDVTAAVTASLRRP